MRRESLGHDHAHPSRGHNRQRLLTVLVLTALLLAVQAVGGLLTGSLALLADAGHLLTDVVGLGLALFAMKVAERPPTEARTYGYHRVEILAALVNGAVLVGICFFILYEALERFRNPPAVASGAMLALGVLGLGVNLAGVVLLRSGSRDSLNVKGAYFGTTPIPSSPPASGSSSSPAPGRCSARRCTCCSRGRLPTSSWPR